MGDDSTSDGDGNQVYVVFNVVSYIFDQVFMLIIVSDNWNLHITVRWG